MYRPKSRRRLSKGDRVRALKGLFSGLGDGTILSIGVRQYRSELPLRNLETLALEHVDEYILSAEVEFDEGTMVSIPVDMLITCKQLEAYDSLEMGDLVVFGKSKQATGLVISNAPRRKSRTGTAASSRMVMVLEDGIKRALPLEQEILSIQRARDYLEYV